jgi:hypothetical protein
VQTAELCGEQSGQQPHLQVLGSEHALAHLQATSLHVFSFSRMAFALQEYSAVEQAPAKEGRRWGGYATSLI